MLQNRISEFFPTTAPATFTPMMSFCAFIPCPVMFAVPMQQTQVLEIYRVAAERTREQLQPRKRAGIPQFSVN